MHIQFLLRQCVLPSRSGENLTYGPRIRSEDRRSAESLLDSIIPLMEA